MDRRDEHVLIVGGGTAVWAARQIECRTSVISQMRVVPRMLPDGFKGHTRLIGLHEDCPDEEWVATAAAIHARDPFTRLAVIAEVDQPRAAAIAEALGLHWHPRHVVEAVCDKARMRAVLAEAGVERVASVRLCGPGELAGWLRDHPGDWIVKPVDGSGSAGVTLVSGPGQAESAYRRCVESEHPGRAGAEVLVEEYLPGMQLSVEGISEDGEHCLVAITRKYSDPLTYVEIGHVVPADLPEETRQAVLDHVARALDALGIRHGLTHTEVVLAPAGPRIIETHLRMAGDEIPELVQAHTGIDLIDLSLRQMFGESVIGDARTTLAAPAGAAQAIWYGVPPCAGMIATIAGIAEAARLDKDVTVKQLVPDGTTVGGLTDSMSRVLAARASGPDAVTAVARAARAVAACTVTMTASAALPGGPDAMR